MQLGKLSLLSFFSMMIFGSFGPAATAPVECNYEDVVRGAAENPFWVNCTLNGKGRVFGAVNGNDAMSKVIVSVSAKSSNNENVDVEISLPTQNMRDYQYVNLNPKRDGMCTKACEEIRAALKKAGVTTSEVEYATLKKFVPKNSFALFYSNNGKEIKNIIAVDGTLSAGSVDKGGTWTKAPILINGGGSCNFCVGAGNVEDGKAMKVACRANIDGTCKDFSECARESKEVVEQTRTFKNGVEQLNLKRTENDLSTDENGLNWKWEFGMQRFTDEKCGTICTGTVFTDGSFKKVGFIDHYIPGLRQQVACKVQEEDSCGQGTACSVSNMEVDPSPEFLGERSAEIKAKSKALGAQGEGSKK